MSTPASAAPSLSAPAPAPRPATPVALVTGAGSGIGRAVSMLLAQRGYALVLMARTRQAVSETAALCGRVDRIEVVGGDVADAFQCKHAVMRAAERFGRLDALINNAAYAPLLPVDQTTPAMIEQVFRTNSMAPAVLLHHAWPLFARQGRGCVVNVSSMATVDPFPGFSVYAQSKASLNLMAVTAAREGAALGVRAFSVAPGAVETPMLRGVFDASQVPASACLQPMDVARVVVECVEGLRDADNGRTILVPSPGMTPPASAEAMPRAGAFAPEGGTR